MSFNIGEKVIIPKGVNYRLMGETVPCKALENFKGVIRNKKANGIHNKKIGDHDCVWVETEKYGSRSITVRECDLRVTTLTKISNNYNI